MRKHRVAAGRIEGLLDTENSAGGGVWTDGDEGVVEGRRSGVVSRENERDVFVLGTAGKGEGEQGEEGGEDTHIVGRNIARIKRLTGGFSVPASLFGKCCLSPRR